MGEITVLSATTPPGSWTVGNRGMVASFSRALTEGLSVSQTDAEFTATLRDSIDAIAAASAT